MSLNIERDLTLQTFAAQWLSNAIVNGQKLFVEDLDRIHAFPKAERIIVCGTGPSLNNDFAALKSASDDERTVLIANHSNLATLLYHEIVPDLVVITDSQEPTFLRLKRDVMPHFKGAMRRKHTCFILPTHAHPELVNLIDKNRFPVYMFHSILSGDDPFRKLYNDTLANACGQGLKTFCLQAGSVSNASVLICNALHLLDKIPNVSSVILSGVDYSYPNGITRCEQVVWVDALRDFEVCEKPEFLGKEIRIVKYNGLHTSEEQVAYYKDLRFIYWNMIENVKPGQEPFKLYTSQVNFLSDFLPVRLI